MLFNSVQYLLIFLPIVFIIYFLLNKFKLYKMAKAFLLFASLFFYGSYKWDYVYIIILSIALNYTVSAIFRKELNPKVKLSVLWIGIISNISILIFFKYFNSLVSILHNFDFYSFDMIHIVMPLGISFFTLQQISYIVDCYKKDVKEYNLLDYSLFICFFPQLIAGPIVRHQEMVPQFEKIENKVINQKNIYIGIFLLSVGLLKKVIFADPFSDFIHYSSVPGITYDFIFAWLRGITKLVVIYFDFSGYCDIAMGSAFLFNIVLPLNFNSPFQANSILDFLNRWIMTLIRFLREYVYKPLGSNKKGELRTYANIIIVFIVLGIWAGFSPVDILSGFIIGIFACINKFWQKTGIVLNKYCSKIITLVCIVIFGQFMHTNHLSTALNSLQAMFGINTSFVIPKIEHFDIFYYTAGAAALKFNIIHLLIAVLILLFCKNSYQLARIYVKKENIFYTFIMVFMFIWAFLSLTKTSEFVYFAF